MKRNSKIQIYCLFAAALFIGIFGAVCFYFGIISEYNDAMGYFNADSLFAPVVYCCLVAGPVLGVLGWVLFRKHSAPDRALPGGIVTTAVSSIAAALILFSTAMDAKLYMGEAAAAPSGITVFSWVLSVLAALSLVVGAIFSKDGPVKPWISLLSFAPVLYCASEVLLLYFDQSVAVNSPIKLICQLSYLSYMLVFTSETGLSLGKGNIFPRYIFTLCSAAAIGGTCSVAAVLATLTNATCTALVGADGIAKIGLFIYVCVRIAYAAKIEAAVGKKEGSETEEIPAVNEESLAEDNSENEE